MSESDPDQYEKARAPLLALYEQLREKYGHLLADRCGLEYPPGWHGLLMNLMFVINNDVEHNGDPNPQLVQIKEKFGTLRVYHSKSDKQWGAICLAQIMSGTICQETGQPGTLRNINGWYVTLCDAEYQRELDEQRQREAERREWESFNLLQAEPGVPK